MGCFGTTLFGFILGFLTILLLDIVSRIVDGFSVFDDGINTLFALILFCPLGILYAYAARAKGVSPKKLAVNYLIFWLGSILGLALFGELIGGGIIIPIFAAIFLGWKIFGIPPEP